MSVSMTRPVGRKVGLALRLCTPSGMQRRVLQTDSSQELQHDHVASKNYTSVQRTNLHTSKHQKSHDSTRLNTNLERFCGVKGPHAIADLNGRGLISHTIFHRNFASKTENIDEGACNESSNNAVNTPLGQGEHMISVTFVDKHGDEKLIKVPLGMSMLEAAHQNDIELEGACEGSLACSTCHVIIMDEKFYNQLPEPTDEENDMLDLAFGLTETSRLGCQVLAKPELDGLRLAIPSATRNFAVDGFVPKPH